MTVALSRQARSFSFPKLAMTATSKLSNPSLLPDVDQNSKSFEVYNPADPESVVGRVTAMGAKEAKAAIERSHQALASWRDGTTAAARARKRRRLRVFPFFIAADGLILER